MDRSQERWARTYDEVRGTLYAPQVRRWDEIDEQQFVVGNVLEHAIFALNGTTHRDRRRAESVLFSKARRHHVEHVEVPAACDRVLAGVRTGGDAVELIDLIRSISVRIASHIIGLDLDADDDKGFRRIGEMARSFAVAAGIEESVQSREEVLAEVQRQLAAFDEDFVRPAHAARSKAIDRIDASAPVDLMEMMVVRRHDLAMTYDDMVREAGFYLAAASDTTAQSVAGLLHHVFLAGDQGDRAAEDFDELQLWLHEALRVRSVVPLTHRRAVEDLELDGQPVAAGTKIHVDLHRGGMDPSVYGDDAETFDPHRDLDDATPRFGFAFGGGVHACLGKTLAAGTTIRPGAGVADDHLHGVATVLAARLLAAGVRPAPGTSPQTDPLSKRVFRFDTYPAVIGAPVS